MKSIGPFSRYKIQVAFGAATLILLMASALSYRTMLESRESERWVHHTHQVLGNLQEWVSAISSVEADSRGFVLTGEEIYLESYRASIAISKEHEAAVRTLTADNPEQQHRLPALEDLAAQKIEYADMLIRMRRADGFEAAADAMRSGHGRRIMTKFLVVARQVREAELNLLSERNADATLRFSQSRIALILGSLLGLGITIGAGWAVMRDTQKRKLAEAALRESEENFRGIFSSVREGIFVTDPETGKFIEVNPAGCRMFGYSREEIIGSDIGKFSSGELAYTLDGALKRIDDQEDVDEVDWHCETRDGRRFWAAVFTRRATFRGQSLLLATLRDITERKEAEATISRMARYDLLTGLANRAVFVEAIQQQMASARRGGNGFAVLYLDLDHFKDVNDTLGHPIGDLLLQAVAERLQATIRETDTVARFGGDEFAVIAADIQEPAEAALLADKILEVISNPFSIQGNEIYSGTSVGVAVYGPNSPDAETLLSHADEALYRAKSEERGTYRFFTKAMDNEVRSRVMLKAELRIAIDSDQLVLEYQPQVNIDTNRLIGLEALVRWQHPKRGLIMPNEFIPAAEKSGLIVALGRWVLQQACRQMKEWRDAGIAPPLIAVNVSGLQFKRPLELENDIRTILSETALPPNLLELEITESVFMEESQEHNDVLARLQKSGIRLAIDDFGTGYSSLSYLGRFPVNRIKIDQNFMLDLTATSPTAKIVKAAISLAHELKLDVVAEGVETSEQVELLRSWDCHKVQGLYFSKPLPATEIAALLRVLKIPPTQPVPARVAV